MVLVLLCMGVANCIYNAGLIKSHLPIPVSLTATAHFTNSPYIPLVFVCLLYHKRFVVVKDVLLVGDSHHCGCRF